MKVRYNQNEDVQLDENTTIKSFLESKNLSTQMVAVAVDETIIKKSEFDNFVLKDGMSIDVFNMVSGG